MTFPNPLIPGFNPDPSIVYVDGTYYVVTSTFEYIPGIPVYASTDLTNWERIGNVITREEQGELAEAPTGLGVWAPTIRYRDGVFYLIITIAGTRGCVVFRTTDPAGPWDDGTVIEGVEGIDPDLTWNDEGVAIVTYSGLVMKGPDFGKHTGIRQVEVDLTDGSTLSGPHSVWSGTGLMFPEAPHLYHRGDYWYLLIAEGGTERGHGVSIARSDSPRGPFENGPSNPFLSARSTTRPVQNTGHGDLVETPDGRTLMVLLGVRPRGGTRAFSALGRETFITEVYWDEAGWPSADVVTLNPREGETVENISFDALLDNGWMGVRRAPGDIADLDAAPGRLTLHGSGEDMTALAPTFIGRRQLNQTAAASSTVDASAGASGGIAVRYDEQTVYSLSVADDGVTAVVTAEARVPGILQSWTAEFPSGPIELTLSSEPTGAENMVDMMTSDRISFIASSGGDERILASVDGRYLSAETAASFTGRVIGLFAIEGDVVFDGYRYVGSER